jgi:hypothetical protein
VKTTNPLAIVATVALRFVGLRETSKNRGPGIAQFWERTNYKQGDENREPWCCAAAVAIIQIADEESDAFDLVKPPKMASVREFLEWAKDPKNGCQLFTPKDVTKELYPLAGDIVVYLPHLSHIGIISRDYANDGFIKICEGNTNEAGSREGDGFYNKQRRLSFAGTFIRLPAKAKVVKAKSTT